MANALNWFEIAASDASRARTFYETVLDGKLDDGTPGPPGYTMYMFPADYAKGEVAGAILQGEGYSPGAGGSTLYLNANGILDDALGRVEGAGGKVLQGRTGIGENGFIGRIQDTEGNVLCLHSPS